MTIQSLRSSYIAMVDILGYSAVESHLDTTNSPASAALLGDVFAKLDQLTSTYIKNDLTCLRYGDGYVIHSASDNPDELESLIKALTRLIANSSYLQIPIRVAVTQGDLKIGNPDTEGLSITGSGWDSLRTLEPALDWMGGFLYLPNYDGLHHSTITNLVRTTTLVREQTNLDWEDWVFSAPFKSNNNYLKDKTWFLNWYRTFRRPLADVYSEIDNWWNNIPGLDQNNDASITKRHNTKKFARYCFQLRRSAHLMYMSEVAREIDLGGIDGN